MAFTVEDGSGQPNANSFVSLDFFRSYCTDMGYSVQAAWTDIRTQTALVRATAYLNARYRLSFGGFPQTQSQALCWPRTLAPIRQSADANSFNSILGATLLYVPIGTVPVEVRKAVCELAIISDVQPLAPNITADGYNQVSRKIGPLEVEFDKRERMPYDVWRFASMLLQPLLVTDGSQARLIRS